MQIAFTPIGTIHTPFTRLDGMPIQPSGARGVQGSIVIEETYAPGLKDLDGFSHLILLYHFHGSEGFQLTITPFLDTVPRGLFATRAPRRPNPIGLSVVRLLGVNGCTLAVQDIDVLDGTPLLDIKPWVPAFDAHDNVRSGWMTPHLDDARSMKSDHRFVGDAKEE